MAKLQNNYGNPSRPEIVHFKKNTIINNISWLVQFFRYNEILVREVCKVHIFVFLFCDTQGTNTLALVTTDKVSIIFVGTLSTSMYLYQNNCKKFIVFSSTTYSHKYF